MTSGGQTSVAVGDSRGDASVQISRVVLWEPPAFVSRLRLSPGREVRAAQVNKCLWEPFGRHDFCSWWAICGGKKTRKLDKQNWECLKWNQRRRSKPKDTWNNCCLVNFPLSEGYRQPGCEADWWVVKVINFCYTSLCFCSALKKWHLVNSNGVWKLTNESLTEDEIWMKH